MLALAALVELCRPPDVSSTLTKQCYHSFPSCTCYAGFAFENRRLRMTVFDGTTTSPIVLCAGPWGLRALWVLAALGGGDCSRDATGAGAGMEFCWCWREVAYLNINDFGSQMVRCEGPWCGDTANPLSLTKRAIWLAGLCALWVLAGFAFENHRLRMTVFGGTTTSPIVLCAGLWSFFALWVLAASGGSDCSRDAMGAVAGMEFCWCWREVEYLNINGSGSQIVRCEGPWCGDTAGPLCLMKGAIRLAGLCALWVLAGFAFENH